MQLRHHQSSARAAAIESLREGHNPVIQMATGTGKSLVIADLASYARQRDMSTWILTHSQTLVSQNSETYFNYTGEHSGIICAGLGMADYNAPVTFASIQSIINPALRGDIRYPDLIMIDEAHRVSHKTGEVGQYEAIFNHYPEARRIAFTATPWRMDNGLIYGKGKQFWFDELAFKYTVPQAVADGWLSPLVGVETDVQLELEELPASEEYSREAVAVKETSGWLFAVARSISMLASKRKHIAVYCPTVEAAVRASVCIYQETGWRCGVISGGMSKKSRDEVMSQFKSGAIRVLVSVDTLTTGFDFPALDCLVCLRPTNSSSLWVQIMGRLTRLHPEKKNGLVLDYVGNLQRLGGVDILETYVRERNGIASEPILAEPRERATRRVLPGVRTLIPIDPTTGEKAKDGSQLLLEVHSVSAVAVPTRRNPTAPVLLVQYACTTPEGARIDASQFITTEKPTTDDYYFFKNRELAVNLPSPANSLIWQVRNAKVPNFIIARKSGRYWNVVEEQFNVNILEKNHNDQ